MGWLEEMNDLIRKNPNRKIIFKIDSEIVADDNHSYWYAESARVFLDETLSGMAKHDYEISLNDERIYSKDDDEDELMEMFAETYGHHYENEIANYFKKLPWEEVIVVSVSV